MRNALITGSSKGIGAAVKKLLHDEGYEVIAPTHSELDLNNISSITSFCEKYKDVTFDVIINNAGVNFINNIDDIEEKEMMEMMNINLIAPIRLIRGLVPNMKKKGYGRIVNVGSIWGVAGKEGRSVYAATKHGIHGFTQTLAVELAPYNILVNTVCPGFTLTELTKKNNTPKEINDISKFIPLGRMALPEEQARTILFMVSSQNTYITGQQIVIDGGYTAK